MHSEFMNVIKLRAVVFCKKQSGAKLMGGEIGILLLVLLAFCSSQANHLVRALYFGGCRDCRAWTEEIKHYV